MWKQIFAVVSAVAFVQTWIVEARGQSTWCPSGSTPVAGGGGNMCRCPDGSYANINGCPQPNIRPQPEAYTPQQPVTPARIPQQPITPDRISQTASVFTIFDNAWSSFLGSQQDKIAPKEWNTSKLLKERQKENSFIAPAPPPGFFDQYASVPNPNVTNANPSFDSRRIQDVKGLSSTSTPPATATPTTLPPPGQFGVNAGVTGFQQPTKTTGNNQSWRYWFECNVRNRC